MIIEKFQSRIKETSISVAQTNIESVRKKDITKTGYRIYKDGFIGVAGTIGDHIEDEMQQKAADALELKIPYTYEVSGNHKESIILDQEIINENSLVNEVEEVLSILKKDYPGFIFFDKVNMGTHEVSLKNDKNLDLNYKSRYIEVNLAVKDKKKSNILDTAVGYAGRKYDRKEFLKYADEILSAYNNLLDLPAAKSYPCIFSSMNPLPISKLATELNGLGVGTKSSLFASKLGTKAFADSFTFYQSSNPYELMLPFFDAEGTVNKDYRYPLIENGVIKAPYADKKTAAMFGLPHTGSSIAEYDGVPTLGFSGFEIERSSKTLKELLGGHPAILIGFAAGGDFTPEGNFASPVQMAMLFDGDKLVGRLPEFQVSSNIYSMFGDGFIGVSKDKLMPLAEEKALVMELNISRL